LHGYEEGELTAFRHVRNIAIKSFVQHRTVPSVTALFRKSRH
jgi:hypothetical protein